ncbi:TetR/AcrR family transcriptional regulator [Burkholderia cenocepacia]|uniref:TetR/AcrR family transcriptional regulator n=1 Tax=Burkholderia cenocepacia TaxID=95486 RepID=UPI0009E107F2|nr:TetR/AcrR family transcriptional regulator [Burkholderia cenocepacia]ARF84922.1 TetR family transcriptional regulator [Burkholderia cenocepacia]MBR7940471.1 TetR family transcriptional regulator [Burkholderia cenocepacia]MBR8480173.1 TetR family transcriptional regulator [Burkholderia cenocepacia]MCW3673772.1 TetR/AcrR family transcriptional regulator [Burkholderia cenocepacia]MDC6085263.1 TetR/AcrR family transcriptional regulator [Burkholderia cenocepacia]
MSNSNSSTKSRPTRSDAQRQAILDAASLLFIEKGFVGTNINDIADAVGMTRTALYYYFPSKESMLEALTREVTERASDLTKEVAQRPELPPDEGLRQLILGHASLILTHPVQFRVVERSESSLPDAQRNAAQAARRAVRNDFVNVIRRGIEQGVFHAVDADVAAFSIIGMCNWCAWWFDGRRHASIDSVAELIASLGLRMLRVESTPDNDGPAAARADIRRALAGMHEALATLESSLHGKD